MAKKQKYIPKHGAPSKQEKRTRSSFFKKRKSAPTSPPPARNQHHPFGGYDRWAFSIILIMLFGLYTFSIRNELQVGQNKGQINIIAHNSPNEAATASNQTLSELVVNGLPVTEDNIVNNTWTVSNNLEQIATYYKAGGGKEELTIQTGNAVKNLSFNYESNTGTGLIEIQVDGKTVHTIDTYSKDSKTKLATIRLPGRFAVTKTTLFWYSQLLVFAITSVIFIWKRFYLEIGHRNIIKITSLIVVSATSLFAALKFIPENYFLLFDTAISDTDIFITLMSLTIFISITMRAIKGLIDTKHQYLIHLFYYIFNLAIPWIAFYILENTYSKLSNVNEAVFHFNIIILYLIWLTLSYITYSFRTGSILLIAASVIMGIINRLLISMRNTPLMSYHFYQIKDALGVASNTEFALTNRILQYITLSLIIIIILFYLPKIPIVLPFKKLKHPRLFNLGKRAFTFITGTAFAVIFLPGLLLQVANYPNIRMDYFRLQVTYSANGFPLTFAKTYLESQIQKPSNYTTEAIETRMADLETTKSDAKVKPNIIIIQNESQADYAALSKLTFSPDPLEFQHSLTKNTISGETVVSVLGGGTANSEYETITSNSLALYPNGVFPYQQLISQNRHSFAATLKGYGYETVAIHPMQGSNYNRNTVYPYLGFDRAYFTDQNAEHHLSEIVNVEIERGWVSDSTLFKSIQHLLKTIEDPLFNFVITMQGHGGYGNSLESYPRTVKVNQEEADSLDFSSYLTSFRSTDQAFKELITFLKDFDEPTMVIMYGDHQPSLSISALDSYLDSNKNKAIKYRTPLIMWANFDIPSAKNVVISPNYTVPYALSVLSKTKYALPISPYYQFLNEFRTKLPVMTTWGYQTKDGKFEEDITPDSPLYEDYQTYAYLQYNNAIDKNTLTHYFE